MGNEWRRKTYYKPRVLIDTQRVLNPQFDDALLCITGSQLEMLRNLTQYLRRRSTFADNYQEGYYYAPTEIEWDEISAIVAELEETLMGCEELMQTFADMLAAMQCVCNDATEVPGLMPNMGPIVTYYIENNVMVPGDVHAGDTVVEGDRCAVAQLVFWQAWGWLTEWVQPFQATTADVLMPLAMAAIATAVGAPLLAVPAALVYALVWALLEVWVDGSLQAVQNSLWAHKDELICAVWAGLAVDYAAAKVAAQAVISDIEGLSPIDITVFRAMFAPWAFALAERAHDNGTEWALANVAAGACDDCDWWWVREWTFPPCPGELTGTFSCSPQGRPSYNYEGWGYYEGLELPDILTNVDIRIEVEYKSGYPATYTVGFAVLEYQDAEEEWHALHNTTCSTTQPAGTENYDDSSYINRAVPRNVLRLYLHGMDAQTEEDPWPFMVRWVRITIMPTL